jgi:hypothetical protein
MSFSPLREEILLLHRCFLFCLIFRAAGGAVLVSVAGIAGSIRARRGAELGNLRPLKRLATLGARFLFHSDMPHDRDAPRFDLCRLLFSHSYKLRTETFLSMNELPT